jgi:phosphatidylglycerophosphate synthase
MPVNSGAFLAHVTITNVQLRTGVAVASVFVLIGVAALATLARTALPVGELYAAKSLAVLALVMIVATSLVDAHHPFARFGAANQMTMVRAALVALVAGLIGEPEITPVAAAATGIAATVVMLDGADGWLARRSGSTSEFGARFDMEIDALLIMALAILAWRHGKAGSWVLLSGLLRYAFVAAGWFAPWLARPLPPSRRRQTVCVVQIAGLCVAVSPIITPPLSAIVAATALLALAGSFLVDIIWLARARPGVIFAPGAVNRERLS